MSTTYNRVPIVSALAIETQRCREAERQRETETQAHKDMKRQ